MSSPEDASSAGSLDIWQDIADGSRRSPPPYGHGRDRDPYYDNGYPPRGRSRSPAYGSGYGGSYGGGRGRSRSPYYGSGGGGGRGGRSPSPYVGGGGYRGAGGPPLPGPDSRRSLSAGLRHPDGSRTNVRNEAEADPEADWIGSVRTRDEQGRGKPNQPTDCWRAGVAKAESQP
ncbi:hypothetical protein BC937DRAFT_90792 [Endogone sp. FLAS-F59071]|nr:hypothetical protein BC937DRAFT_90792 [Endogone sp. FLAS-F59071]|eukprot:RUS23208.1 hypothetical protein BC937DRAFT_90792 [Endogone sp. FLAS-F59071]